MQIRKNLFKIVVKFFRFKIIFRFLKSKKFLKSKRNVATILHDFFVIYIKNLGVVNCFTGQKTSENKSDIKLIA